MSIKLSIKDLKDLLKIQNKQLKKRSMSHQRRAALRSGRKNKRIVKTNNDNYNKSSSDHMKSIGFTNTSNEATELIRLQRQALEDKLKADKEKAEKEKEMGSQIVPFNNNAGSNNMRRNIDENTPNNVINYILNNLGGGEVKMVPHGHIGDPDIQKNTVIEALPTSITTPATVEELPTPIKIPKGKTKTSKTPKTPEQSKTPEPAKFDIDIGDETLNTKVKDTTKPDNNYLNSAMSNIINPRKLLINRTDVNNILPTRTRGQDFSHTFDVEKEEKGPFNMKDNDTTAPVIPETKPLTSMTKPQLLAFINAKSDIKHGSLITKDKAELLKLAQAL